MKKKKRKVDAEKVRMLASFGCKYIEIAKYFEVDESLIRRDYKVEYQAGREEMKFKLRRAMWVSALENNAIAMQIFLAKNILNMSDKTAVDMTGNLQTVLKECGFEESNIGEEDSEQGKVLEPDKLQADSESSSSS